MMQKRKDLYAYMTVEASLLLPIILLLLVTLLYLILFKYNEVTIFQSAAITALYGKDFSYTDERGEELTKRMYGVLEKLNDGQYLALSFLEQKVEMDKNDIIVSQNGRMRIPFRNEEMEEELFLSEKVVVDTKNYIFYIRQVRKVRGKND